MAVLPSSRTRALPETIDILVEAGDWPDQSELRLIAEKVVEAASRKLDLEFPANAELSLVFSDDCHIQALNRRHRDIDRATNVLSFPAGPAMNPGLGSFLGDIVLAMETISRESQSQGLTIEAHLSHLILHGFLHILGYDHENEVDASAMERLETEILSDLNIADPYAEL